MESASCSRSATRARTAALVLVVEDIPLLQLATTALVRSVSGLVPTVVTNGYEAVAAMLQTDFDLVVVSQEVVHTRDPAHGRLVVQRGVWTAPVVAVNERLQGGLALG